jgi:hypothetical protein
MTKPVLITSALALAFALASCGNTPTAIKTAAPLTGQNLAVSTAAAVSDEAASAASSLTASNAMTELSFNSVSLASSNTGIGIQSDKPGERQPGFKSGGKPGDKCVTITPSPVVDSDKDGVPDTATMTFDCTRDSTGYSFSRTGTVQISDPLSTPGDKGFDSIVDLSEKRSNKLTGRVVTESRKGERHPRRNGDKITQNHDMKIVRSVTDEPDASIHNVWKSEFTATTPGSILKDARLPAGSLSINGTHEVVRDGATRTYALETSTALSYDPACDADIKYVAGVLKVTSTGANKDGTLEIAYGACGSDPVITKNGIELKVKLPMPSK